MRRLLIAVLVLAGLYAGYWWLGARTVTQATTDAIEQARAEGWQVQIEDRRLRGFPSRFDTTLEGIVLTPPDGAWTWTAPFVQIFALAYRPNEVIAVFPPSQSVTAGTETVTLATDDLRMSAKVAADTALTFDHATARGTGIMATSDAGWALRASEAVLAARRVEGAETAYDLYGRLDAVLLPEALTATLGPDLPQTMDQVLVNAVLTFDRPLDRTLAGTQPLLTRLDIGETGVTWGPVRASLSGALNVDAAGVPDGEVDLSVTSWEEALGALVAAGAIPAQMETPARFMARGL